MYSTSILLAVPMFIAAFALRDERCPFNLLLLCALLSGAGGGAFASSMSSMSALYPKSKQGYCLGVNGGFGNFGVSISQLVLPILMSHSFGSNVLSVNEDGESIEGWPCRGTYRVY